MLFHFPEFVLKRMLCKGPFFKDIKILLKHFYFAANSNITRRAFYGTAAALAAFINLALAESNQGYANTQIPITLALHCILDTTIPSVTSFSQMLNTFTAASGNIVYMQ